MRPRGTGLKRRNRSVRRKVGGIGCARKINTEELVDLKSGKTVRPRPAKISRINQLVSRCVLWRLQQRIDHRNKNVLRPTTAESSLDRRGRSGKRKSSRGSRARDINQSRGINRHLRQKFRAIPADIRQIVQSRVDDKFTAVIVLSDRKSNFVGGKLPKASLDQLLCIRGKISRRARLISSLINPRCVEANLPVPGRENQIARIASVYAC